MDPRTVYQARNTTEASLVQGWLKEAGIEAQIFNGEMQGGAFEIIETDPEVIVHVDDYERAREVVEEFLEELQQATDMSAVSDAEGQFDWPMCPGCDELRSARCDNCSVVGTEFSTEKSEDGETVICLACSEATLIHLVDQCQFCGHDFTETVVDKPVEHGMDAVNSHRVAILVVGLIILLGVLGGWFIFFAG